MRHSFEVPAGRSAPTTARHELVGRLEGHLPPGCLRDVELLVSELVTNSVRHARVAAGDRIGVEVAVSRARVRVSIVDAGADQAPAVRDRDPLEEGGMGLLLVDQISQRWGVRRKASRRTEVWFELGLAA